MKTFISIIVAMVVAFLVYLFLKVIRFGLKRLLSRFSQLNLTLNLLVAINFMVWLAYAYWVADFLFGDRFYYPFLVFVSILIVAGLLSWFLLRDIFAGMVFRVRHNLKNGSVIHAGTISGQIISQDLTFLKIRTEKGMLLRIPYSRLNHEIVSQLANAGSQAAHILTIEIDKTSGKVAAEQLIRTTILNMPWSSLKEDVAIKSVGKSEEGGYLFEVSIFSMSAKQLQQIEMALEKSSAIRVITQ